GMSRGLRLALVAWGIVGALVVVLIDWHGDWSHTVSEWVFFAPSTLLIIALGYRAWRLTDDRAARIVIAMLWFRWVFGFAAYFFGPLLHMFEALVWAETTGATLISVMVIATAVLRSELFSLRSSAAEALLMTTLALITL